MSEFLDSLAEEIRSCKKCDLCKNRTNAVPGHGNSTSGSVVFVGEAPGANEDADGIPFTGAAGQVLDGLLLQAALRREEVYITNLVKCRPTDDAGKNRPPSSIEVNACNEYLMSEIAEIVPKIIVLLGASTIREFIGDYAVGDIHGEIHDWNGLQCMAMYHPATLLYRKSSLPRIESDFQKLRLVTGPSKQFEGASIVQDAIYCIDGPWEEIKSKGGFARVSEDLLSWIDYLIAFSARNVANTMPKEKLGENRIGVWLWEELVMEQSADTIMLLVRDRLENTNDIIKAGGKVSKAKLKDLMAELGKRGLTGKDSFHALEERLIGE